MSIEPATKLAHYDVVEPIGAGAIGAVCRACVTKLERDVQVLGFSLAQALVPKEELVGDASHSDERLGSSVSSWERVHI